MGGGERFWIGTSGWSYGDWRGRFYPSTLPSSAWLSYYAERFRTVEINASYYRLPAEAMVVSWRGHAPQGFLFAVKANRFITHIQRLEGVEESLERFTMRVEPLGDRLGPILLQLPPGFHRDDARLQAFLRLLSPGHRYAIEFRHESWLAEPIYELLGTHGVALCVHDHRAAKTPVRATTNFAYVRFHGPKGDYANRYGEDELRSRADELRVLAQGLEAVFAYFNNDYQGYAVEDAVTLRALLGT